MVGKDLGLSRVFRLKRFLGKTDKGTTTDVRQPKSDNGKENDN